MTDHPDLNQFSAIAAAAFVDWHLPVNNPLDAVLFPGRKRVPPELHGFANALAKIVVERERDHIRVALDNDSGFMIDVGDLRYRVQVMRENELYALRLSRKDVPELGKDVRLDPAIEGELTSEVLKKSGGLVIINGAPGSGKTWTAMSAIIKRLEMHGGYCLTIEDPPEMAAEGWHGGSGYLEQMDASKIGYKKAVANSLRCFPAGERAMMLIGEIRHGEPAAEMLRIAISGHLVFTTVHAKDHAAAFQRIVALAQDGGEPDAKELLASSLRLSINQQISNNRMSASMLKANPSIHGNIKRGEYSQLAPESERQTRESTIKREAATAYRM